MKRSQFLKSVGAALALPASLPFTSSAQRLAASGNASRGNCVSFPARRQDLFLWI